MADDAGASYDRWDRIAAGNPRIEYAVIDGVRSMRQDGGEWTEIPNPPQVVAVSNRDRLLDVIDRANEALAVIPTEYPDWKVSNRLVTAIKHVRRAREILAEAEPTAPEKADG